MTTLFARRLLWPMLFAAAVLTVLIGLGTWQWHRLIWKQGLIDQIATRIHAPAVALSGALRRFEAGEDMEYTRVTATGTWLHDRERLLWAPRVSGPGWNVFTPLATAAGPIVIVNRGFVADADRGRSSRPEPDANPATVVGLMRRPETRGAFTPDNDIAGNRWFWRDWVAMSRSMLGEKVSAAVPFFVDAERRTAASAAAAPRAPEGGATLIAIPNNHLQYVVTWYGLAVALIGVCLSYAWSALSRRSGNRTEHEDKQGLG